MRKLILGIVAVFCVQIMFQIFMAVDRSDAEYRARNESGPLVDLVDGSYDADVAALPGNDELVQIEAESIAPRRSDRLIARRSMSPGIEQRAMTNTRAVQRPTSKAALVARFQKPGIDFAAPPEPRDENRVAHLVAKESSPRGKRSLLAKVIKKPYDWLRAVGSKLR